jgi:hypothetical protein
MVIIVIIKKKNTTRQADCSTRELNKNVSYKKHQKPRIVFFLSYVRLFVEFTITNSCVTDSHNTLTSTV